MRVGKMLSFNHQNWGHSSKLQYKFLLNERKLWKKNQINKLRGSSLTFLITEFIINIFDLFESLELLISNLLKIKNGSTEPEKKSFYSESLILSISKGGEIVSGAISLTSKPLKLDQF